MRITWNRAFYSVRGDKRIKLRIASRLKADALPSLSAFPVWARKATAAAGIEFKAIEIRLQSQFAIDMRYHCFCSLSRTDHLI
jgi:hypothetical protein